MDPLADRHGPQSNPTEPEQERQARNNMALLRFGLMLGVAILIASAVEAAFFAPTLSSFLFIFAVGSGLAAAFAREPVLAEHLTRWDQAAGLMLLSLLAKAFIDPEVLRQATQGAL